jgi:hypothetical protein
MSSLDKRRARSAALSPTAELKGIIFLIVFIGICFAIAKPW